MNFNELKRKVTDRNNKMKLIHTAWLCLKYVEDHPAEKCEIGIFWLNEKEFMLNSSIFGSFTNIKPNTMNRNFRTHGFSCKKTTSSIREYVSEIYPNTFLPDPKNWIIRWCENFSKSTTEAEAKCWQSHDNIVKHRKNKSVNDNKSINNDELISNLITVKEGNGELITMPSHEQNPENMIPASISFDVFDDFDELRNEIECPFSYDGLRQNNCPSILDSVDPFEPKEDAFQKFEREFYDSIDEGNNNNFF